MIITVVAILIALSVPLTRGRLDRLGDIRFRAIGMVLAALGLQVAITTILIDDLSPAVLSLIHLFTYVLAAGFLWLNRRVPGLLVIAAGGMANFAAIGANDGVMPASQWALQTAGIATDSTFENSMVVDGARLQFLGDIFAIPESWPFANVFSVGDLVLLVGVAILVHTVGRWPDVVAVAATTSPGAAQPCCDAVRRHVCCRAMTRGRSHASASAVGRLSGHMDGMTAS